MPGDGQVRPAAMKKVAVLEHVGQTLQASSISLRFATKCLDKIVETPNVAIGKGAIVSPSPVGKLWNLPKKDLPWDVVLQKPY